MSARTVIRAALAMVLGSLAVPALTSPGSAGQAPPEVVVSARAICGRSRPTTSSRSTIVNPGAQTYQVEIFSTTYGAEPVTEVTPVTVDPGETETVVLDIVSTPMDVSIRGDGDFPDQELGTFFHCPRIVDITATTPQDTAVVITLQGPCSTGPETPHGTVEQIDNFTIRYTPAPGFVGDDTFGYSCSTSAELDGTITVTVTALQAPPAEPVAETPTFTG